MKNSVNERTNLKEILSKQALILVLIIGLVLFGINVLQIFVEMKIDLTEDTKSYREDIENRLIADVNNAISIANTVISYQSDENTDEITNSLVRVLESISLNDNSYYFGADYFGNTFLGPGKGNNYYDIEDKNGLKVVQELIEQAKQGGGFVEYTMPPIDGVEQKTKISYVLPVEKLNYYIGAGIEYDYINNVDKLIKDEAYQDFWRSLLQLLVFISIIIFIAYAFNQSLYRNIFKHVQNLIDYIKKASTSQFVIPIDSLKVEEFKTIAIETQALINKRDEQSALLENQIRNENQHLEEALEERTKDLKNAMEELFKSEKMASLGNLVAGIAHEINTPLGVSITSQSYLSHITENTCNKLKDNSLSKRGLHEFFESAAETNRILESNLHRSAELIKSFKTISVSQSYDIKSDFDIVEVIQSVIIMLKHEYKNSTHSIHFEIAEPIMIHSYQSAYSQIFTNLIMNSLVHAYENKEDGNIHIGLEVANQDLILTYTDDGKGVEESNINKIFDPFFTTKRGEGGSGLGLSITYNLVTERLGGNIECSSQVDQGIHFKITIPDIILE